MRGFSIVLLLAAAIFLTLSCASRKKFKQVESTEEQVSLDSIYRQIFNNPGPEWFSGKARISVEDEDGSRKATAYLRIRRDSVIWAVFKKHSVEAARLLLTPDSVKTIYRLEKKYEILPADSMQQVLGLEAEFGFLSDLLIGQLPSIDTTRLWKTRLTTDRYEFRSMHDQLVLDFYFNRYSGLLDGGVFYDRFGRTGEWSYSDYRIINSYTLPFQRDIHVKFADASFQKVQIEFLEMAVDTAMDIRFSIPGHYEKLN